MSIPNAAAPLEKRLLFNCLIKTRALTSGKKLDMLEPWRYRVDRLIIHRDFYPGLFYIEGPDPVRLGDFVGLIRGNFSSHSFKVLRQVGQSARRPATLPRTQQRHYPELINKAGAPLPPLPNYRHKKWWTTRIDVYSLDEFAHQMKEMGVLGWYRNAIIHDVIEPTKCAF
jgi:hypothetical protein